MEERGERGEKGWTRGEVEVVAVKVKSEARSSFFYRNFFYRDSHFAPSLVIQPHLLLASRPLPRSCAQCSLGAKQDLGDEKIEMYLRRFYIADPVALHSA
jgi:hypothetical protein